MELTWPPFPRDHSDCSLGFYPFSNTGTHRSWSGRLGGISEGRLVSSPVWHRTLWSIRLVHSLPPRHGPKAAEWCPERQILHLPASPCISSSLGGSSPPSNVTATAVTAAPLQLAPVRHFSLSPQSNCCPQPRQATVSGPGVLDPEVHSQRQLKRQPPSHMPKPTRC